MSDESLTLFVDRFYVSPYALSAYVALEEKGLPYRLEEIALDRKQHFEAGYQAQTQRVPALKHGDFWLAESMAIAEYLAETFPFPKFPRLFPADLRERAIAREVMQWVRSDLMPIRVERSTNTVFYAPATTPLSAEGEAAAQRLVRYAESRLTSGRTTLFAEWCLADTDFAMMLQRLAANAYPLPAKVKAYVDAQWQRPSVRRWVERERPPYQTY